MGGAKLMDSPFVRKEEREAPSAPPPVPGQERTYTINDVHVRFPHQAYPSQIGMMQRVIQCLQKKQNGLLESPTGSGKTLALLCAALAWQQHEKMLAAEESARAAAAEEASVSQVIQSETVAGAPEPSDAERVAQRQRALMRIRGYAYSPSAPAQGDALVARPAIPALPTTRTAPAVKRTTSEADDDDEAFQSPFFIQRTPGPANGTGQAAASDGASPLGEAEGRPVVEERTVPKIYFASRTHKQIAQVVRELRRTSYKPLMSVLSSREHTCIQKMPPEASKNEECRRMVDLNECRFATRSDALAGTMRHQLFDIEDLVKSGRRIHGCPYFAARTLAQSADLILCPYNYLVDPQIRDAMAIDVGGNIVIFDEAHNMEDACREAGSLKVTSEQLLVLKNCISDVREMARKESQMKNEADHALMFALVVSIMNLMAQLDADGGRTTTSFERSEKSWEGRAFLPTLAHIGIIESSVVEYKDAVARLLQAQEEMRKLKDDSRSEKVLPPSLPEAVLLPGFAINLLETIVRTLSMVIGSPNQQFVDDYILALIREPVFSDGTRSLQSSFNLWCLNPNVIFRQVSYAARSVVLTSGTLSPMESFASELGVPFEVRLEAMHVIPPTSVWVGAVTSALDGTQLSATYKTSETFPFQDKIGENVLSIVQAVPHGVLCFFPSYSMLDKMVKRWRQTGLWARLAAIKQLVAEPRSNNKKEFETVMKTFYGAIATSKAPGREASGAVFFAVCRGKVSEGLDFADENARAVIAIGIPYPNFMDPQVKKKREYNDRFSASRKLLNANQWYDSQAFRALNQALGRCIRHRKDWGAIVLLDERFGQPRTAANLSKWMRNHVMRWDDTRAALASIRDFVQKRIAEDRGAVSADGDAAQAEAHAQSHEAPEPTSPIVVRHADVKTPMTPRVFASTASSSSSSSSDPSKASILAHFGRANTAPAAAPVGHSPGPADQISYRSRAERGHRHGDSSRETLDDYDTMPPPPPDSPPISSMDLDMPEVTPPTQPSVPRSLGFPMTEPTLFVPSSPNMTQSSSVAPPPAPATRSLSAPPSIAPIQNPSTTTLSLSAPPPPILGASPIGPPSSSVAQPLSSPKPAASSRVVAATYSSTSAPFSSSSSSATSPAPSASTTTTTTTTTTTNSTLSSSASSSSSANPTATTKTAAAPRMPNRIKFSCHCDRSHAEADDLGDASASDGATAGYHPLANSTAWVRIGQIKWIDDPAREAYAENGLNTIWVPSERKGIMPFYCAGCQSEGANELVMVKIVPSNVYLIPESSIREDDEEEGDDDETDDDDDEGSDQALPETLAKAVPTPARLEPQSATIVLEDDDEEELAAVMDVDQGPSTISDDDLMDVDAPQPPPPPQPQRGASGEVKSVDWDDVVLDEIETMLVDSGSTTSSSNGPPPAKRPRT